MISFFFPAYPFRGDRAPYLWVFYRVLTSIKEPVYFMIGADYLTPLEQWEKSKRWELTNEAQKRLGYQLPKSEQFCNENIRLLDESSLQTYLQQCFNNPDELFRRFLTEPLPEFIRALKSLLNATKDIECILTWCNCPSLNEAAREFNIPVINLEQGPLRYPEYLSTAYFDFSGVNGNTEAEKRYLAIQEECQINSSIRELRTFFARDTLLYSSAVEYGLGIVLQVENDSNILAFNNSFNNQSILDYAELHFPEKNTKRSIRAHPGSRFTLQEGRGTIDRSATSIDFIKRCQQILTINSSVGLEAMLLEVPVTILGDCSYAFCNVEDRDEKTNRLAFYLFTYLIPFNLLFDIEYIRFRLSSPTEAEITQKHVEYYLMYSDDMDNSDRAQRVAPVIEQSLTDNKIHILTETIQSLNNELAMCSERICQMEETIRRMEKMRRDNIDLSESSEVIVDIIIPVYAGLQETQECIESALKTLPSWANLVVINDVSPEPELTKWLRERAQSAHFILLENEENLGFVSTVNRGMKLNPKHDILLLNSDVEVANGWLERMKEAAYSRDRVGSITPFSNNATICSFPNFCEDNELFLDVNVQQLDDLFAAYGRENNLVEIPTGVGFCMYIRRDCLNEIGYFDAETFGRGYGEENDWCQRAAKAGWPNFHQLNVFVYHKGGVSFAGEQDARKTRAMELLNKLHPNYITDVMSYINQDPAKKARQQMVLRILAKKDIAKVLLVSHNMGGGVAYHINELIKYYQNKAHFLLLMPEVQENSLALFLYKTESASCEKLVIDLVHDFDLLVSLLRFIGVGHIHFHHLIGVTNKVFALVDDLACTYDITVHDYYFINANPTLTDKNGLFVGDGVKAEKRDYLCGGHYPVPYGLSVQQWREHLTPWFNNAERVIFPSADLGVRFFKDFPQIESKAVIAWHPDYEANAPYPQVESKYIAGQTLKVLVLGALSREKGALLLDEVANELKHENMEFHLLGYAFRPLGNAVKCHGAYSSTNVQARVKEIKPDIIWYPAQWPETYSYTLSIALELGLPVMVPNLGAFYERVVGRCYSRIIAWDSSVADICKQWRLMYNDPQAFFDTKNAFPVIQTEQVKRISDFYQLRYIQNSWLHENGLGRIDHELLLQSISSVSPSAPATLRGKKEKLLIILWKMSRHPLLSWLTKLIPYSLQRKVKQFLSRRAIHEIVD